MRAISYSSQFQDLLDRLRTIERMYNETRTVIKEQKGKKEEQVANLQ